MSFHIVIFTHYKLSSSYSMPRFASLLAEGMRSRGHQVDTWTAPVLLGRHGKRWPILQKWLGYIDQFLIFPLIVRWRLSHTPMDRLFIFSDHALGPWVPLVAKRPHVIHCHDFLALRGALGELPNHHLGFTGRIYQRFIRWGFCHGQYFISVSAATQFDLHRFLLNPAQLSVVVYNPLNSPFAPMPSDQAYKCLKTLSPPLSGPSFVMHIGNNWYKNRMGVLQIFEQLSQQLPHIHLVMISNFSSDLQQWLLAHPLVSDRVYFYQGIDFEQLQALYSSAQALIFPSLYEGFGWPILEALACGCPVLTTNSPPMTEVGGKAAYYLPTYPQDSDAQNNWAKQGAALLLQMFSITVSEHQSLRDRSIAQVKQFTLEATLENYEKSYQEVLNLFYESNEAFN